jgi:hypothetical protein
MKQRLPILIGQTDIQRTSVRHKTENADLSRTQPTLSHTSKQCQELLNEDETMKLLNIFNSICVGIRVYDKE